MKSTTRKGGFTLLEILIVCVILALIGTVVHVVTSAPGKNRAKFEYCFDTTYPKNPDERAACRDKVLTTLIVLRQQYAESQSNQTQLEKELKEQLFTTPAEVTKALELMDRKDRHLKEVELRKAAYDKALHAAYAAGYTKEALLFGYVPPRCGC